MTSDDRLQLAFVNGHRMYEGDYTPLISADQPSITATAACYVIFSRSPPALAKLRAEVEAMDGKLGYYYFRADVLALIDKYLAV